MKISLNTMKQLTGLDLKIDELVQKINLQLGQVEDVVDLEPKYKDVVIAKVVTREKHPNADKLSFCRIDDGGVVKDVVRDDKGLVEVVCGAPNVRAGLFVAWLPPKSTVPASFNDKEPFVLDSRELRGVLSHGMIASAKELDLGDDHSGIIEITEQDLPKAYAKKIEPGLSFSEVFGLNDEIIELENKMFTHRPDCFGQIGVAREIFAIMQPKPVSDKSTETRFKELDWYWGVPQFESREGLELGVVNEAAELVPRFMAVAMKDVEIKPSPLWMQVELVRWGSKPINNVVDATNYIMLLTAQPTHAYDYDKLAGHQIGVRMAHDGESIKLLNDKSYKLTKEDIVIVDGDGAIGLAGVMGGMDSEVTADTKNVVLECATFDMYAVRKTSMRYGLFTDAVTRFNKGQSPIQTDRVLHHLMALMPANQASPVYDLPDKSDNLQEVSVNKPIDIKPSFINERLGLGLNGYEISNLLRFVNFASYPSSFNADEHSVGPEDYTNDSLLNVNAPFWRTDIELPEDIVEEVGRLYGLGNLPVELPKRTIMPSSKNSLYETKKAIRKSLARSGANEVLTYSFVHENTMKRAEQDVTQAFQLGNALSPDLQYYRLSVLPSLLEKVHPNIKTGHDEFVLFEIGKGHNKKYHADDDDGLPKELQFVDAVYASKKPQEGAAFYQMRKLLTVLARDLGFTLRFKPIEEKLDYPVTAPFDQTRSALVESRSGEFVGMVGELKQSVIKKFKLPAYVSAMTLDLEGLNNAMANAGDSYRPLSRYPKVTQDISLKVSVDVAYEDVFWTSWQSASDHLPGDCDVIIEPISIYRSDDHLGQKTVTLRLTITSYEKTLTDKDVSVILDYVANDTKEKLGAVRI